MDEYTGKELLDYPLQGIDILMTFRDVPALCKDLGELWISLEPIASSMKQQQPQRLQPQRLQPQRLQPEPVAAMDLAG